MIQLPDRPWSEGDTFTNETTGVEYTFDGVKWLASGGEELDLSGFLPLSGGEMEPSASIKVNNIAPVNTPSIFYDGSQSSHPMGLMNRGMISDFIDDKTEGLASEEYVDGSIAAIEFPETDLSDYVKQSDSWDMSLGTSLGVNVLKPLDGGTPYVYYEPRDYNSTHPCGIVNRGLMMNYVDGAIDGIDLPDTDLSDYATIEYVDDLADSIAAILDFDWSDLGGYKFHRASDYPGSGIIQCKVPGGAPQASSIQKLMVHKTNADGSTNDINAILKAGNILKLGKGQTSDYYKIVDSRVIAPNVELDVEWLRGEDNKLFLNDRISVQEGAVAATQAPEINKSRITTQVRTTFFTQARQAMASFIDRNGDLQIRPDNAVGIEYTISRDTNAYFGYKDWWGDDYEPLDTGYIQVIDPFTGKVSWAAGIGEVTVTGDTIRWMVSGSIYTNYPDWDANRDYFLNLNGCLREK